jgi:NADP-dependent 3-hydroxy acid dehydrogenase YdfG
MKLTGTAAIVTGASSGIGRATALDLAPQGASVAVVARRANRLDALVAEIEKAGGTALAIPTDTRGDLDDEPVGASAAHKGSSTAQ